jgi:predicted transposase/invertase (TIGR01784 family)
MPRPVSNIHDKFVKELLAEKERAVAFLEGLLPPDLVALLEFDSLTYLNTSYLSQSLKASYSDVVWRVALKQDQTLQVCLLLEHKSYPDPFVGFQLLEYIAQAYKSQRKEAKAFEVVVPVLYYHGSSQWDYKSLRSHFTRYVPQLLSYVPDFATVFIDLQSMQVAQIERLRNGLVRTALEVQRYYADPQEINEQVGRIIESLGPYLESNFVDIIFVYLLQNERLSRHTFRQAVQQFPPHLSEKAMSIYDELIQEGIEKGRAEGIEKGIEKGRAEGIENTILRAFDNGLPLDTILLITGENIEKVNEVLKRNGRN